MQQARIAGVLFGSPGSGSFVEAGARAFEHAREKLGARVEVHWLDRADVAWRLRLVRELAATSPGLIVLHGAQGEALVQSLAADFPGVHFAIAQGDMRGPNVSSFEVQLEHPAYLAGVLAGCVTQSGVIGHLSGERVRAGLKGRAAFAAGVRRAAPQARFLTTFCGDQHDAGLAARCLLAQRQAGADIAFTMLGAGRQGAIQVCKDTGLRQIGDGIDWCAVDAKVFIASALADSAWGSLRAIEAFLAGQLTQGRHEVVGLEQPQVCRLSVAPDVPARTVAQLDALAGEIVRGKIVIPPEWEGTEFPA